MALPAGSGGRGCSTRRGARSLSVKKTSIGVPGASVRSSRVAVAAQVDSRREAISSIDCSASEPDKKWKTKWAERCPSQVGGSAEYASGGL